MGWFHSVLFERAVYTRLQSSKTLSTTFWQPCIIAFQTQKATMESLCLAKMHIFKYMWIFQRENDKNKAVPAEYGRFLGMQMMDVVPYN